MRIGKSLHYEPIAVYSVRLKQFRLVFLFEVKFKCSSVPMYELANRNPTTTREASRTNACVHPHASHALTSVTFRPLRYCSVNPLLLRRSTRDPPKSACYTVYAHPVLVLPPCY